MGQPQFHRASVVVGFADLSRFFAAATGRDPLEVAEVLQRHYERMGEIIVARGGRVIKCIGDALLFSFPQGCERAAVLAVREMVQAAEEGIAREWACAGMRLGAGLAAGEVAAGEMGPAEERRYDLLGDPVNAAALACHGGGICVTEEVRRALGDDIAAEPAEPIRRAGREIAIWRLV